MTGTRLGGVCHEAVVRDGVEGPCERVAVAVRIDPRDDCAAPGSWYPVCRRHTREPLVPLSTVLANPRPDPDGPA